MAAYHYGTTKERIREIIKKSKRKCQICGKPFKVLKDIKIDHCHTTNKVRGVLCHSCNITLGYIEKNERWIDTFYYRYKKYLKNEEKKSENYLTQK
jgi:5-methylcytosine-specific restriction endonuclease McrA